MAAPSGVTGAPSRAMFDSHASESETQLLLYTDSYRIRGNLRTRRRRLTDILNQEEADFLVVEDVVYEELASGALVHRATHAQVNLDTVLFGVSNDRVHPLPDMRTTKVARPALIGLPPFTIRGRIHLNAEPDLRTALRLLQARFVPVTEAVYWSDHDEVDEPPTQAVVVAFNHARAQILAPYEEEPVWEGVGGSQTRGASASDETAMPGWVD